MSTKSIIFVVFRVFLPLFSGDFLENSSFFLFSGVIFLVFGGFRGSFVLTDGRLRVTDKALTEKYADVEGPCVMVVGAGRGKYTS